LFRLEKQYSNVSMRFVWHKPVKMLTWAMWHCPLHGRISTVLCLFA